VSAMPVQLTLIVQHVTTDENDISSAPIQVTIPAGSMSANVLIPFKQDHLADEPVESFNLIIQAADPSVQVLVPAVSGKIH
ncbi:MAG: hypothetical protein ACJ75J_15065, partial [Cytophagaceae bacterium]